MARFTASPSIISCHCPWRRVSLWPQQSLREDIGSPCPFPLHILPGTPISLGVWVLQQHQSPLALPNPGQLRELLKPSTKCLGQL